MPLSSHACLTAGLPFVVTELMERGTLQAVLEAGPLDWSTKLRYAREVASGMQYVHSLQRIHRDLKSTNLLVSKSNHVKVADFGTSTLFHIQKDVADMSAVKPRGRLRWRRGWL